MLQRRSVITAAAFPLVSCNPLQGDQFEVVNRSTSALTEVRLAYADDKFERPSLAPGKTFVVSPSPDHDGGILLSYRLDGQPISHVLGYAAPPISTLNLKSSN
ncbi:MAG: hypothetical protein U1E37_03725 [Sphingomonadaceae bacterium]|mgnify:CR=1 FL=1